MNYLKVNLELHQLNIVWRFLGRAVTGDKNKNTTGYSGQCDCDCDSDGDDYVCGEMHLSKLQGVLEHRELCTNRAVPTPLQKSSGNC